MSVSIIRVADGGTAIPNPGTTPARSLRIVGESTVADQYIKITDGVGGPVLVISKEPVNGSFSLDVSNLKAMTYHFVASTRGDTHHSAPWVVTVT
ncbi:hypothetical protein BK648_06810 [Pseudomonas poae]|jgi:hypothetical protein|uniref:Bacterial Ig-like domain-containing protein n=1 Tax=Pseudomonas poae TaxID=200451 RepID=A0A423FDP3_9PSED|nr:hypothetical protein [Pseudomonas poae]ROM55196.1 hypothetical protein BK648_06810 [Pseudomonas poae]